jgi:hypothetical protein
MNTNFIPNHHAKLIKAIQDGQAQHMKARKMMSENHRPVFTLPEPFKLQADGTIEPFP